MTDCTQLIESILRGETAGFARIVEAHKRLVTQIVFRMIPSEADREDICQDVFVKVFQNLSQFRYESKLSTWIARVAYNTCLNFIEKKRPVLYDDIGTQQSGLDDRASENQSPAEWVDARRQAARLSEEIDKLPTLYGLVLSLYHLQEMTYAEIGAILKLPDGTVKSYLFRARKMLRDSLGAGVGVEGLCA